MSFTLHPVHVISVVIKSKPGKQNTDAEEEAVLNSVAAEIL